MGLLQYRAGTVPFFASPLHPYCETSSNVIILSLTHTLPFPFFSPFFPSISTLWVFVYVGPCICVILRVFTFFSWIPLSSSEQLAGNGLRRRPSAGRQSLCSGACLLFPPPGLHRYPLTPMRFCPCLGKHTTERES